METRSQKGGRAKSNRRRTKLTSPPISTPTILEMTQRTRRYPIGAELTDSGAHFRVWSPTTRRVRVRVFSPDVSPAEQALAEESLELDSDGYHAGFVGGVSAGCLYGFLLDEKPKLYPDPASRFQPTGPHGLSQLVDPFEFAWTDQKWKGVDLHNQIIYELHLGTFTPEGSWRAAIAKLPELAQLGVTLLEVMPIADFPGRFGWGYDGVNMFAPTRLYGKPDDARAFVDAAHAQGLGVILDVVYNHFGPDGNYLKEFTPDYFTERYKNEWGEALNFDGPNNQGVREFFVTNARYWIEEYHLDGLRLDATQQISDASPEHILVRVTAAVREGAKGRKTFVVAENETQHSNLIRPVAQGGYGIDAVWNDDFQHSAAVAFTGHNEAYYSDYHGKPQEFISAAKYGYLYQGQWYQWQEQPRGLPTWGAERSQFVNFIENHDQVANSLRGYRAHQLTSPGKLRAMTALLLLSPGTPMLFQGEEFAATSPFLYFADHNPELRKLVHKGRKLFLGQFPSLAAPECQKVIAEPGSEEVFQVCKLDWNERERNRSAYALHRDLLRLRREDPVMRRQAQDGMDGAVLSDQAFLLRFFARPDEGDRLLLVNLGPDQRLNSVPEPLLAPPEGGRWKLIWSSEHPEYGGTGTPPSTFDGDWRLPGQAALFFASEIHKKENHGKADPKNTHSVSERGERKTDFTSRMASD